MKQLTLIMNGLSWPYPDAKKLAEQAKAPMLEQLLGLGCIRPLSKMRREVLLDLQLPADKKMTAGHADLSAALCAQADGFEVAPEDVWMLVQPVHVYAAQDGLHLAGTEVLEISSLEAGEIVQSLNQLFAAEGWQFFAPHPARWYLRLPKMPRVLLTPLAEALTLPLDAAMPAGEEGGFWRKVFNEAQILLFSHPVNQAREAAGLTLINSLWFSALSDGVFPAVNLACDAVLTEDFFLAALAKHAQLPCDLPPFSLEHLEAWQAEAAPDAQHVLFDCAILENVARYEDAWHWLERLQEAEARYFLPLWQLWKLGKIDILNLISPAMLPDAPAFQLTLRARDRWAFWRSKRSLSELY